MTAQALGKEQLYLEQSVAVRALWASRDVLVHLPTAFGKTLIGFAFLLMLDILLNGVEQRLPIAQCFMPVAIYISPLVALMDQQAEDFNLHRGGLYPGVSCSNESLSAASLQRVRDGLVSVLFMSPEHALGMFLWIFSSAVYAGRIVLLFIDEAHCVSEWSHDFRPDYAELKRLRSLLSYDVMCLAASATLTFLVKREIGDLLGLQEPEKVERPNYRPEIYLENIQYVKDEWRWIFGDLIQELKDQVALS